MISWSSCSNGHLQNAAPAILPKGLRYTVCPLMRLPSSHCCTGLWPTNNDGSYPCYCSGSTFNPSALSPIIDEMDRYWPSFQSTNDDFWSHEWEKHGTCCADVSVLSTEFDFFNTVLKLRNKYNLYSTLVNAGIFPSDSSKVDSNTFKSAIESAFGATPVISCQNGNLDSITICLTRSFSAIDCPNSYGDCGSSFYYLSNGQ